jgi:hypothetical protein
MLIVCGVILFAILFCGFVASHRLSEWLNSLRKSGVFRTRCGRQNLDLIAQASARFALILRGAFLAASFWTVDLYLSLCQGGVAAFAGQVRGNIISTVLALALACLDTARGKSVEKQGLPTMVMSTWGFFQFFKNFILLMSASEPEFFRQLNILLSHPLWFLDGNLKYQILRLTFNLGALLTFTVLPLLGFAAAARTLFHADVKPDARNCAVALMAVCGLFLTAPAFLLYVMIFGVPNP